MSLDARRDGGWVGTLAVTGASGFVIARELLRRLHADPRVRRIFFVTSPSALRVLAEELGLRGRNDLPSTLLGGDASKVVPLAHEDIGAAIASGSYPTDAMIVAPCSVGTLAGIAHGMAGNLIERAADVCLKERRRLVLCVRETPLHLIHLRNMTAVAEAGATIYPVIPSFYNRPQTTEDMASSFADRVLQHVGLPQANAFRWGDPDGPQRSGQA